MNIALINPAWDFTGSIYFGCREPHLPLEFGYAKALLEAAGHHATIIDGQLDGLNDDQIVAAAAAFRPEMMVITTAPSYLFWRCAPPELRVPMQLARRLRPLGGSMVAVGPHASSTPEATLRKLGVDLVVMGECEEVLVSVAAALTSNCATLPAALSEVPSICYTRDGVPVRRDRRQRLTWLRCRRSAGRTRRSSAITITITALMHRRVDRAPRWKCPVAVRTAVPSAPRKTFATSTGSVLCR